MKPNELREIDRFLTMVGEGELFGYFSVPPTCDQATAELAIKDKREWAQQRQSNPKYRDEAIWVIRNTGLLRRALGTERSEYLAHIDARTLQGSLHTFDVFVQGASSAGMPTDRLLQAIAEKGAALGIPQKVIDQKLEDARFVEDPTAGHAAEPAPDDSGATGPVVVIEDDDDDDDDDDYDDDDYDDDDDTDEGADDPPSQSRWVPPGGIRKPTPQEAAGRDKRRSQERWSEDRFAEFRATVRGMHMQGVLKGMRTALVRKGTKLGLDAAEVEKLIEDTLAG